MHRICILLIMCVLCILSCTQKKSYRNFENIDFQEGDIVFRKGNSTKSQAVLYTDTAGVYSHAGIIALINNTFMVIHIAPGERKKNEKEDKIKAEPINDFWSKKKAQHGAIYRLKDNSLGKKAAQQAIRLLKKEILFDHDYKLDDTTKMYCTEFVWYIYSIEGQDITFGKRSQLNAPLFTGTYIFPSDIYRHEEFDLIFNF
ncbi:MAG: hypothetical protein LBR36_04680 [Bacteroidales bacterium]|nr:hypothetical protein [Bacteroidales bacterium]